MGSRDGDTRHIESIQLEILVHCRQVTLQLNNVILHEGTHILCVKLQIRKPERTYLMCKSLFFSDVVSLQIRFEMLRYFTVVVFLLVFSVALIGRIQTSASWLSAH